MHLLFVYGINKFSHDVAHLKQYRCIQKSKNSQTVEKQTRKQACTETMENDSIRLWTKYNILISKVNTYVRFYIQFCIGMCIAVWK